MHTYIYNLKERILYEVFIKRELELFYTSVSIVSNDMQVTK